MPPSPDQQRLLQLLDERHVWPSLFAFKFIVPRENADALKAFVPEATRIDERASSGGKYTAFTLHCPMGSAQEVLALYARVQARGIPGLIAL